jgi:ribonuclease HI
MKWKPAFKPSSKAVLYIISKQGDENILKSVCIFTDGACSGNPGPGGWGCVLQYGNARKELKGGEKLSTNQRMEMTAAIKALEALKEPCQVEIYSDSAYLVNAFNKGWLDKWRQNGWLTAKKQAVENQDLWRVLLLLSQKHKIKWYKVKGHSGDAENERCDELARSAIEDLRATTL